MNVRIVTLSAKRISNYEWEVELAGAGEEMGGQGELEGGKVNISILDFASNQGSSSPRLSPRNVEGPPPVSR